MSVNYKLFRMWGSTILFACIGLALLATTVHAQQFAAKDKEVAGGRDCPSKAGLIASNSMGIACDPGATAELASSGHAFIQNQAGIESALVLGPNRTIEDARKGFQKAAAQGDGLAQVNLAVLYLNGWGVPQNYGSAVYWLNSAAAQGISRAHTNLGILYLTGAGVRQDYAEARRHFQFAAEHGDTGAMVDLGYMSDLGLGDETNRAAAAEWYRRAAQRGDSFGQNNLADMYLRGEGVPQNDKLAFAWFQKAAEQGHTGARIKLGFLYMTGRGVREDAEAAYAWILGSSLAGDSRGEEYLASLKSKLDAAQLARATQRARELQASPRGHVTDVAFFH